MVINVFRSTLGFDTAFHNKKAYRRRLQLSRCAHSSTDTEKKKYIFSCIHFFLLRRRSSLNYFFFCFATTISFNSKSVCIVFVFVCCHCCCHHHPHPHPDFRPIPRERLDDLDILNYYLVLDL